MFEKKSKESRWHRARDKDEIRDLPESTSKLFTKLSAVMAIFAVATAALPIFGYFVMLGVADALHLDAGLLWGSASDVFHFAFMGFLGLSTWLPTDPLALMWRQLQQPMNWGIMGYIVLLVWVMVSTDRSPVAIRQRRQIWLNSAWMQRFKAPIYRVSLYKWLLVPLSVLIFPMALFAFWLGLVFLWGVLVISALFGMSSGRSYVDLVQSATTCSVLAPKQAKSDDQAISGRCVRVQWWVEGKQFEVSGFLIVATSTYVLLRDIDMSNKQIQRIPVSSTTVVTTLVH